MQNAAGSDYLVEAWNSDRGLPQNTVSALAQTKEGYLWVGMALGGVARFDGVRFAGFDPASTPAIPQYEIRRLEVDSNGTLWIAMAGGRLARLEAGAFILESKLPAIPNDTVRQVTVSATNGVYVATMSGRLFRGERRPGLACDWESIDLPRAAKSSACRLSEDGRIWFIQTAMRTAQGTKRNLGCWHRGQIEPTEAYEGLRGGGATKLSSDGQGQVWVGTDRGFAVWKNGQFIDMTPGNGEQSVAVQDLVIGSDGGQWVRTAGRLRKSVGRQWIAEAKPWQELEVPGQVSGSISMFSDQEGGVWLTHADGQGGIWHVRASGEVRHLTKEMGLPEGQVNCWLQDREGNVWLGFEGGGLARVRPRYFQTLRRTDGAAGAVVRSVCEDQQGGIWLGSADGKVSRWQEGKFSEIKIPEGKLPTRDLTLWPDRKGNLWIGTVQSGLWMARDDRAEPPVFAEAAGKAVRMIFEDSRGRMWFDNGSGLLCWDGTNAKQLSANGPGTGPQKEKVLSMAEDARGALWMGTANGHLWEFQGGKFTLFTLPGSNPNFRFWSLLADRDGTVWVGTLGGGLLRFRDGTLGKCTMASGLASDTISQLLEDAQGQVWAGSRAGIFSVSKKDLNAFFDGQAKTVFCRTFNLSDGLPTKECSGGFQPSCWRGRDGRLWFATAKGAVSVQPADLPKNSLPPRAIIEGMSVDGVAKTINPALPLPPGPHYVEFRFTGLSLTAPESVRFQWRLEGLEPDWVDGGSRRSASYSFLPPGEYRFRVRACNNEGIWSEPGTAVGVVVLPHYWQRWWFPFGVISALLLATGSAVAFGLRTRHRRRLAQLEQQRTLERERSRIAQDLHDDLGASLAEISLLGGMSQRPTISPERARQNIGEITAKSRAMLRALDEIVWAVNPQHDTASSVKNYFCQYAQHLLRLTPIRCRLEVESDLPSLILNSEQRHGLFLAFKEALSNVISHSDASEAWIRILAPENCLTIQVDDNGKGFSSASPAEGADGLGNMQRRLHQLGGRCEIESTPGKGTVIRFLLPMGRLQPGSNPFTPQKT